MCHCDPKHLSFHGLQIEWFKLIPLIPACSLRWAEEDFLRHTFTPAAVHESLVTKFWESPQNTTAMWSYLKNIKSKKKKQQVLWWGTHFTSELLSSLHWKVILSSRELVIIIWFHYHRSHPDPILGFVISPCSGFLLHLQGRILSGQKETQRDSETQICNHSLFWHCYSTDT